MSTVQTPFNDGIGSPTYSSHSTLASEPESLPHFVFPMKPEPSLDSSTLTQDADTSTNQRKRPLSKTRPQHISVNALPPFEFNPSSAGSSATLSPTPPRSPNKAAPHPSRAGHRRGGSEFIGGDGKSDGPGLMSTSPTKGEGMLPPPPSASRMGPPGGRRGHAHRRSGAISSHDLSNIIRPSIAEVNRAESAPTTPSEPGIMQQYLPNHDKASSQPALVPPKSQPQSPVSRHASLPSIGHARPRVGFSDTLEFIPRPLSTISSETSSSFSTVRPGHSVTGSISSIVSGGTSSPPSARASRTSYDLPRVDEGTRARPPTASASLDSPSMKSVMQSEGSRRRPSSVSGSPNSAPGKRGIVSFSAERLPSTHSLVQSDFAGSSESLGSQEEKISAAATFKEESNTPVKGRVRTQRKVKSWAGSILNKRGKSASTVETSRPRPPTPPLRSFASAEDFPLDDLNFDDEEDPASNLPAQPARIDFSTWKPRQTSPRLAPETLSPTLDLDAAMGPFNTPSMSSDSDQSFGSGFSSAKRRMHSAGATGAFSGPGMHYHRRAESAPEMAPVTDSAFDAYHSGSTPAMADVFEEDEEDDQRAKETAKSRDDARRSNQGQLHGLGVAMVDSEDDQSIAHRRRQRKRADRTTEHGSTSPSPTLQLPSSSTPISLDLPVEIVDATEEPRFSVVTKSSDESTITPTLSANAAHDPPHSVPTELTFPPYTGGLSAPSETASSVLSSPDFTNTSFDVPRLNTAHSSITDRTTWSISKASERGSQDHAYPADDVPSLTSSASTMISAHPSRFSNGGHSSHQPSPPNASPYAVNRHSASLSAVATLASRPASPNKRSSLASLSRLIGSSHAEKSKLSIESTPTEEGEGGTQRKKRNRISRLMRFWKAKEKSG